jgi:hypothetical protein
VIVYLVTTALLFPLEFLLRFLLGFLLTFEPKGTPKNMTGISVRVDVEPANGTLDPMRIFRYESFQSRNKNAGDVVAQPYFQLGIVVEYVLDQRNTMGLPLACPVDVEVSKRYPVKTGHPHETGFVEMLLA